MRINLKKVMSGVAALAVAASVGPFVSTPAAGAAAASNGSLSMTPSSGDSQQDFVLDPDDPQVCPGDGATDGYRWQTFFVDAANDPASLTYTATGPSSSGTTGWVSALFSTNGNPVVNQNPDIGTANISGIPVMDFSVFGPDVVPAGEYYIGIACTLNNVTETFWQLPITVTTNGGDGASNISYAVGARPPMITDLTATPSDGAISLTYTSPAAEPPATAWTAVATPQGGGTSIESTDESATGATFTGLVNGTTYDISVTQTNDVGTSAPATTTATPGLGAQPAVRDLTASSAPGSGTVDLDWNAPSGGVAPTGYTVAVDPSEGTVTVDEANTSAQVAGLTPGSSYDFTVTATYADPTATPTPATITYAPPTSGVTVLTQTVTVERPAGALVFTQRCEDSDTGAPLPGADWSDAACAIEFGEAERVLEGENRGRFFTATASLNDVQVDSWGDDTGWNVTGDISDEFRAGDDANQRFSGDQMGWDPEVVSTTTGMDVVEGATLAPGTADGLTASPRLASSPAGSSLGIAELDAELSLLIPVQARAGVYQATLTLTATPTP